MVLRVISSHPLSSQGRRFISECPPLWERAEVRGGSSLNLVLLAGEQRRQSTVLRSRSLCRNSTRRILPLMVFGSSVVNSMSRGYL
jgi:hypothetical protein